MCNLFGRQIHIVANGLQLDIAVVLKYDFLNQKCEKLCCNDRITNNTTYSKVFGFGCSARVPPSEYLKVLKFIN